MKFRTWTKNATGSCGWMRCHSRCPKQSHVPIRLSHCDMLKKDIKAQLPQVAVSPLCAFLSVMFARHHSRTLNNFKISKSLKMTKYGILQITYACDQINTERKPNQHSVGSWNNSLKLKIWPLKVSTYISLRRINLAL